jgi:phage tail-like protein
MPTTVDVVTGDPVLAIHFGLDLGDIMGYFMSIDGLGSESEVVEHKIIAQNGADTITRKQPGRLTWGDITLKRGLTGNIDFYNWIKSMTEGDPTASRRDGSIIMYDATGAPIAQWDIFQAWPSKVSGPTFSSDSSEVAVEEVTLVHEGITRSL